MRYVTDLVDNFFGDKLEDRTDKVAAEKVRLSQDRKPLFPPQMATKKGPTSAALDGRTVDTITHTG